MFMFAFLPIGVIMLPLAGILSPLEQDWQPLNTGRSLKSAIMDQGLFVIKLTLTPKEIAFSELTLILHIALRSRVL